MILFINIVVKVIEGEEKGNGTGKVGLEGRKSNEDDDHGDNLFYGSVTYQKLYIGEINLNICSLISNHIKYNILSEAMHK